MRIIFAVTSLESTLVEVFILNNLNLFRMNTYEKHGGVGVIMLT